MSSSSVIGTDPNAAKNEGYQFLSSLIVSVDNLSGDDLAGHFTKDMACNFGGFPIIHTQAATAHVFRWLFRGCDALSHDVEEVHNLPDRIIGITTAHYHLKNGVKSNVRAASIAYKRPKADKPDEVEMYQFDYFGDFQIIFQHVTAIQGPYNPEGEY